MKTVQPTNDPTEAVVTRQCDELASAMGFRVVRLDQRRSSRVHQGLPDRRYVRNGAAFFFEVKRPSGRISREQFEFIEQELEAGVLASCGGLVELRELIMALASPCHVGARNVCRLQLERWHARGFRGESKRAA